VDSLWIRGQEPQPCFDERIAGGYRHCNAGLL
jgi:hypothetical protein